MVMNRTSRRSERSRQSGTYSLWCRYRPSTSTVSRMCVLIITIPWGIAAARIGVYALWPFGKTVVATPNAGVGSFLGNVIWVVLAGWWIALEHLISGIALCITIIGIPFGIANFKLIPVALMPLGKQIVDLP